MSSGRALTIVFQLEMVQCDIIMSVRGGGDLALLHLFLFSLRQATHMHIAHTYLEKICRKAAGNQE